MEKQITTEISTARPIVELEKEQMELIENIMIEQMNLNIKEKFIKAVNIQLKIATDLSISVDSRLVL